MALVNTANPRIEGGGGVTGAISEGLSYLSPGGKNTFYSTLKKYHEFYDLKLNNPFIDEFVNDYIIHATKLAYDNLHKYFENMKIYLNNLEDKHELKEFNDKLKLPDIKYLIHVAGPDISHINDIYTQRYLDEIKTHMYYENEHKLDIRLWKLILRRTFKTLLECAQELKITDLYLPLISGSLYAPDKDSRYALEVYADVLKEYQHLELNIYIVDHTQELLNKSIKYLKQFNIQQIHHVITSE
jgi:O-acetyl-ADP-ribose deacetylase (regulator of RNase III)